MNVSKPLVYTLALLLVLIVVITLVKFQEYKESLVIKTKKTTELNTIHPIPIQKIYINRIITIENYFDFIDSLVKASDTFLNYPLSEHVLVRANPWIIDTLSNTDYYTMMKKDSFVYD